MLLLTFFLINCWLLYFSWRKFQIQIRKTVTIYEKQMYTKLNFLNKREFIFYLLKTEIRMLKLATRKLKWGNFSDMFRYLLGKAWVLSSLNTFNRCKKPSGFNRSDHTPIHCLIFYIACLLLLFHFLDREIGTAMLYFAIDAYKSVL